MTHGGKRPGAGRPTTNVDERRLLVLQSQGVSQQEIADRFGVSKNVIGYRLRKMHKTVP